MDRARQVAIVLTVALAACSPAVVPSVAPTTAPPPRAASAAAAVTEAGLRAHLEALAAVSGDAASGYRAVGSPGYDAAADLVATTLRSAGWTVAEDAFETDAFADPGGSSVALGGERFGGGDIRPLIFAPPGEVTGPLVAIDWRAGATERDGEGCHATDYGALPERAIVLVRPGPCYRREQILAAQAAGAAAFIAAYPASPSGLALRPTLIEPDGLTIPAVGASGPAAEAIAAHAAQQGGASLRSTGRTSRAPTRTILAELPGSDPSRVVMLGAHLDSVIDGPGIDDDGSGVAALLELAEALGGSRPRATIRLAFWSGEELGLQGSGHYVRGLGPDGTGAIVAYINADMVGSPNGFAGVYDAAGAPPGSQAVAALLGDAVERAGGRPIAVSLDGSDHQPFREAGIPVGGVFSGASEPLGAVEAESHGGSVARPADACYHSPCDDLDNVDLGLARILATALTDTAARLANTPELLAR